MEPLTIHEKRKISTKSWIFCAVMLLLCAFLVWYGFTEGGFFYLLIGGAGILYFGYCLILAIRSLVKKPAILTIEEQGIRGAGTASALDFISYDEIARMELFRRMKDRYIGIIPKDEAAFLERLSPARREAARANIRLNLPPVFVRVEDAVEMSAEAIVREIETRLSPAEQQETR
ncbi:MAG: hypothetical protein II930_08115 [Lachnospiraceae bacterium]|nr:hypothetical protein [Lachnospiraceae bacterium]